MTARRVRPRSAHCAPRPSRKSRRWQRGIDSKYFWMSFSIVIATGQKSRSQRQRMIRGVQPGKCLKSCKGCPTVGPRRQETTN